MTTDVLCAVFWPLSIIIAPSILFGYIQYVRSAYCGVCVRQLKAQLSYAYLMANADDSVIFAPPFSDSFLSASFIWKCYFFKKTAYFWCLFVFSRRWQQSVMFLRWCDAEIALRAVWSDTSETKVALTHLVPALCWFISFLFHCACSVDRRPVRLASDGLWIFYFVCQKLIFFSCYILFSYLLPFKTSHNLWNAVCLRWFSNSPPSEFGFKTWQSRLLAILMN